MAPLKSSIKYLVYTILLFAFTKDGFAQKEFNIWSFGENAGIDFNSSPPSSITTSLNTLEGTSSICDPSGQLLFYTNGANIWDRQHNVMPNGSSLSGGSSSTHAALIVPLPSSCNLFYVFTTEDHYTDGGLSYSIVDMCLNGGFGDVVSGSKNTLIRNNTSEKISAILHANKKDVWILTHALGSNQFLAYLLTSGGLNLVPVTTSIGYNFPTDSDGFIGPLKVSHRGTKIVSSLSFANRCEMFDFDPGSGQVSNAVNLNQFFADLQWIYGVEFSMNDSLLYLSTFYVHSFLYQLELKTGQLTILNDMPGHYHYGALQMGPDHKIYMARNESSFVDVIHQPEKKGTSCEYTEQGLLLQPGTSCNLGLPSFVSYFLNDTSSVPGLGNDTVLCLGETLELIVDHSDSCSIDLIWSDGSTGESLTVSQPGTYWVKADNSCIAISDTIHISYASTPEVAINDTVICDGQSITLDAFSPEATYLWSDMSTNSTIEINEGGIYWVEVSNACASLIVPFEILAMSSPDVVLSDSVLCEGEEIELNASFAGATYLWSDFSTQPTFVTNEAGSYWVEVTNECGTTKQEVTISFLLPPEVSINDSIICDGQSITLDASSPEAFYLWSDFSTAPSLTITQEGLYSVVVSNGCGVDSAQANIQFEDCDLVVFVPNVFSPNQDGINDFIGPSIDGELASMEFQIFDRWGNMVFKSNSILTTWNGYFKNKKLPAGVYAYTLGCESTKGSVKQLKGNITLLR